MLARTTCPSLLRSRLWTAPSQIHHHTRRQRYTSDVGKSNNSEDKAFAKSLLLPKTSFPLWSNTKEIEGKFRELTCDNLYRWQWENAKGPLFVFHDGPPYANGDLHMGHALNKVLKDIINRFQLLQGRKIHYVPGWDCHGLPIENKTLKDLKISATQLPPEKIRTAANATALREVESQKAQFRTLGIMADWDSKDRTYRTLDHQYEMRQLRIFQKMVEKGLIYRHYRPVHYSPSSRSALAEAELVYKDDHVSHSVFVTFDLDLQGSGMNDELRSMTSSLSNVKLLVWTTTPWTLTANMGIAVNSELEYALVKPTNEDSQFKEQAFIAAVDRLESLGNVLGPTQILARFPGSQLVNASYKPIFADLPSARQERLPVVHSGHVKSDSGTGLVHCAPAHGPEDYHAFRSLGLIDNPDSILCHVGPAGEFLSTVGDVVGRQSEEALVGKSVLKDGSRATVDLLKEVGNLVKIQRIKHRYPYDWKTDEPIIMTATSQWFANLDDIKQDALDALQDVSFYPAISRNRLESFVRSRSEWCISRQRVWGVPIPALYSTSTDKAILDSKTLDHILEVLDKKGVSYWWSGPITDLLTPELLAQAKTEAAKGEVDVDVETMFRRGTDTMDVWFDSGTSWSMIPGMIANQTDGERMFSADVCLEGSDQHRGWFQSQLLTRVGSTAEGTKPSSPYGTLITHGMVLDEKGRKMSKSLGNIVSPLTVINGGKDKKKEPAYGADILRLWAGSVECWGDMSIGPTILTQTAESYRKIRNSARFCLGNIDGVEGRCVVEDVAREDLDLVAKYVMHELYILEQKALEGYSTYNFPKVVGALTHFSNITLSSFYFDITKDCLYANPVDSVERRGVVTVLKHILHSLTKIMAPILPHLAEEIHATWRKNGESGSVFMTPWKPLGPEWQDLDASRKVGMYRELRAAVSPLLERARKDGHIRSSLEAGVDIIIPDEAQVGTEPISVIAEQGAEILKTIFIVSDASITLPSQKEPGQSPQPTWEYTTNVQVGSSTTNELPTNSHQAPGITIRIRPAPAHKCPRCWTYTRQVDDSICSRCVEAIGFTRNAN
ncbi:isoleucyl-tRNA synthetase [Coprinopsis marcescibilis]|uniref:Isoleucine--tRNA ligase, mitochondrial n=1 Tax=Coprinopsis marcescibilis TaxID=230819 RepID=A0A5C3KIV6_COPMA|nr:isoleucyl-tRNA synthetase [Coprinopsis marcescibilis]